MENKEKSTETDFFNECYDKVKLMVTDYDYLNPGNCLKLSVSVMKLLQTIKKNKGDYKKKIVLALIKKLVQEYDYKKQDDRKMVLDFVDYVLPDSIDLAVSLSRGDVDIGKTITSNHFHGCC